MASVGVEERAASVGVEERMESVWHGGEGGKQMFLQLRGSSNVTVSL